MIKCIFPGFSGCLLPFFWLLPAFLSAQPGASVQLDKPKKFENRTLASEKSTEGKFNPVKRANQNLNTRYNFVFNSERKLNEVLFNARSQFKDNFGKLLPFYNYTLDQTAEQERDLDSVIMKCNDAILLHDLRNDWVDDCYLLMGRAYFYRKNLDSAAIAFQYINFAFQPRDKDEIGYNKNIGSNLNTTGNVYTISTREKNNVISKTLGHTPVRNDAILWFIRTLIEKGRYNEAWSIMVTLDRDVNFPSRLEPDLNELKAYWYYGQGIYDSSSHFLQLALGNASGIQEKARWEYLIAQMLENSDNAEKADEFYGKSISHTTDPVLEAYARINRIRLVTGDDEEKRISLNIEELMKLSKKGKYEDYRHLIFYAAAKMELRRNHTDQALRYLRQSAAFNTTDPAFKNMTWLLLADLAFEKHEYTLASAGYDSLDISDPTIPEPDEVQKRKSIAAEIVRNYESIRVEDSLIHIASMPEAERTAYVKSLVKKLRRERGLKEEENAMAGTGNTVDTNIPGLDNNQPTDIFASNNGKGEWYFYNTTIRAQGFRQFKVTWGNRPNVDNWRRGKAINVQSVNRNTRLADTSQDANAVPNGKAQPKDLTVEALNENLPLTPELLKVSNDTIASALHQLGKIYREKIGDCESLIRTNEELLNRYPASIYAEEALFGLYYCYHKEGNMQKAAFYKDYLAQHYNQSRFLRMINDPKGVEKENKQLFVSATKMYDDIYNRFIEGDFTAAIEEKKKADSLYGENYWTPQLLYIQSVYYIKERQDSMAILTLKNMMALYPESPMSAKAATMIEVLQRRNEIENYLTNLQVTRTPEDSVVALDETVKPKPKEQVTQTVVKPGEVKVDNRKPITVRADTATFKVPVMEKKAEGYVFKPTDQHLVVLLLNKVDVVYVNEARNALNRYNKEKYYNLTLDVSNLVLDETRKMVTIASFSNIMEATDYMEKAKTVASTDIFPWMPKDKYSFFVITASNLVLLETRKDVDEYLKLLKQNITGK